MSDSQLKSKCPGKESSQFCTSQTHCCKYGACKKIGTIIISDKKVSENKTAGTETYVSLCFTISKIAKKRQKSGNNKN